LGKSNINLLVLGVAYKGMAIPLLWKFLTIEEEKYVDYIGGSKLFDSVKDNDMAFVDVTYSF
jgi:hypothetical protein